MSKQLEIELKDYVRDVPDFPKPGIIFKDLTPLWKDAEAFAAMVEKLAANDEEALHDYRRQAPNAARNHPTDEHLLPLYFARGAGGAFSIAHQGFTMGALGMDIYRFG